MKASKKTYTTTVNALVILIFDIDRKFSKPNCLPGVAFFLGRRGRLRTPGKGPDSPASDTEWLGRGLLQSTAAAAKKPGVGVLSSLEHSIEVQGELA